ncbi:MAG: ABC transporter substrate-binding protein, partial [Deltaproteobacteria bacterium]|nr:ABC transporter substrate-binding protein [Deltaproteobacteria bacterium]
MKKIVLAVTFLAGLGLQTVLQAKATNEQLVIGVSQEFEHLNPLNIDSVAIAYVSRMINRPLVSIDTHWNYFCHLCTQMPSFENGMVKKSAEQGKEKLLVTWELKPNAKWGDGKPLTGHDVKFSWEIGKSSNVMIAEKDYYTQIEEITVDPKNPQRFTMKFGEVKYNFYRLTNIGIVPQHIEKPIWEKTKTQTNAYEKASTYVGNPLNPGLYSGPYLVAELKLGSHVVLKPNPNFYGEKPKIQKIIFRFIPNTQALEAA